MLGNTVFLLCGNTNDCRHTKHQESLKRGEITFSLSHKLYCPGHQIKPVPQFPTSSSQTSVSRVVSVHKAINHHGWRKACNPHFTVAATF